jgi:Tfp pilus assembly protein PilO
MGSLSQRDRRALLILGAAVAVFLLLQFGVFPRTEGGGVSSAPIDLLERRLRRLQQLARQKPRAAAEAEAAARELAEMEKGLLKAATPALASAEMQQVVKELLTSQGIALQSSEFGPVKAAGEHYAQVPLTVVFTCGIEQWINWMTAVRNAPQILATEEMRLSLGDPKNKTVQVRMVVAGFIPASRLGQERRPGAML